MPEHPEAPLPLSRWEVVRRGGEEIAIVAIGRMVGAGLEAAALLARHGVEATVVNARWLKPLDGELLEDVARRHRLMLTVEEGIVAGGLGTAVLEALAPAGLSGKVRIHGLPDRFLGHGRPAEILAEHGLTGEGIAARVRVELGVATAGKPQLTA
jgi:1-deoxy-D-xylulose-5-phosphate synthase